MKICQIVPSLEAKYGGPSKSIRAISAALARAGHDVELLATDPAEASDHTEGRLRVRVFRRDWPQRFCPSAELRAALRASDADIVHHHSLWLRTLHYAHHQARSAGKTFVLSPRGMMRRGRGGIADGAKPLHANSCIPVRWSMQRGGTPPAPKKKATSAC